MLDKIKNILSIFLFILVFSSPKYAFTQIFSPMNNGSIIQNNNITDIQLVKADTWYYAKGQNNDAQVISGNVIIKHDSVMMYCDSALYYQDINSIDAFGNIHIIENDTLHLYGKFLKYDGNTKLAFIKDDVTLLDPHTILKTDQLFFDRATQTAYYKNGATITNGENNLVSKIGYYHTYSHDFIFNNDVVITNPDYILKSDTVFYNTYSRTATVVDSTVIYNKDNTMFCKNGIYNLNNDKGYFNNDVEIHYDTYIIYSDSIYYDNMNKYAEGYGHVNIIDTVNHLTSWSSYLEYNKLNNYSFINGNARARMINNSDTVYVLADTIYAVIDSTLENIKTYHNTKIVHKNFQAICDSAIYFKSDSCVILYKLPALWSGNNQITGDSIIMYANDSTIDRIVVPSNGFIVDRDSLGSFNQIKGNEIIIYFIDNKINSIKINGDSKTIYFLRNDDGSIIGPNFVTSTNSKINFSKGELQQFVFYKDVHSNLYPAEKSDTSNEKLDGLKWRIEEKTDFQSLKRDPF